jgi:hypothetical protein
LLTFARKSALARCKSTATVRCLEERNDQAQQPKDSSTGSITGNQAVPSSCPNNRVLD